MRWLRDRFGDVGKIEYVSGRRRRRSGRKGGRDGSGGHLLRHLDCRHNVANSGPMVAKMKDTGGNPCQISPRGGGGGGNRTVCFASCVYFCLTLQAFMNKRFQRFFGLALLCLVVPNFGCFGHSLVTTPEGSAPPRLCQSMPDREARLEQRQWTTRAAWRRVNMEPGAAPRLSRCSRIRGQGFAPLPD